MIRRIFLCLLLLLLMVSSASAAKSNETLQALLDKERVDHNFIGVVAMVSAPNGTVYQAASGLANTATSTAMTVDMHFRIASVSKTFTAALCLKLQEEGHLNLDDPLTTWFPNSTIPNASTITLRQILAMRSGIKDLADSAALQFLPGTTLEWSDNPSLIEQSSSPALFSPGADFHYSPVRNMVLAGLICESVMGKSYRQLLKEYILDPFSLSDTSIYIPTDATLPVPYANMYGFFDPNSGTPSSTINDITNILRGSYGMGASGMVANAADIITWIGILSDSSFLNSASQAQMMNFIPSSNHEPYGLGLMDMGDAIGHTGSFMDAHTSLGAIVGEYELVILTNGCTVNNGSTARSLMQTLIDDFISLPDSTVMPNVLQPLLLTN